MVDAVGGQEPAEYSASNDALSAVGTSTGRAIGRHPRRVLVHGFASQLDAFGVQDLRVAATATKLVARMWPRSRWSARDGEAKPRCRRR